MLYIAEEFLEGSGIMPVRLAVQHLEEAKLIINIIQRPIIDEIRGVFLQG